MTQSTSSATKTSPKRATPRPWWLLVLIFRLLLLGVGGGLALIAGIVLANVYPNSNPEKPLIFKVLEGLDKKIPVSVPQSSAQTTSTSSSGFPQLTPVERQQAQAKLNQLQAQLNSMNEAVTTLETELGSSRPNETLETRMQAIALQLEGVSSVNPDVQALENSSANQLMPVSDSVSSADKLKLTLPSDLLFDQSNSILRPEASLILDKIITDLRGYSSSTIRITAHMDADTNADADRELSFRRAKAVQQYLVSALGDQYRWVVVGYGGTRPLIANDTDANRQRNRRVEIAVD
ncbi:OmpA family protein [Microcoleus sp. FACHB-53]|nr:OmpA family protein [Microcoleus sp. FACHB-53]